MRRGETRTCRACGAAFYLYPSQLGRDGRTGVYCSRACYLGHASTIGDWSRGRPKSVEHRAKLSAGRTGVPRPHLRKAPIVITCPTCGLSLEYAGRKRYFAQFRKFCSTECWYGYLRTHPEAHNWFKGGYEPYYGPNWRHQAKLARQRDDHACRVCGVHQFNPRLDVHHLNPRRSFGRDDFEAMNALDNLITVCKSCHTKLELGVVSV